MSKPKKILVVAAHSDDEILGCGATLIKHQKAKDEVHVVYMTDGETSRVGGHRVQERYQQTLKVAKKLGIKSSTCLQFPDNAMDQVPLLELVQAIEPMMSATKFDTIYTHHLFDVNIDHCLTARAVLTAARPMTPSFVPEIFSFEVLSSTHWFSGTAYDSFSPNYFVDISNTLEQKIKLMSLYKHELREYPHPRSAEGIKVLAQFRGMQVGVAKAEAFVQIRKLEMGFKA